MVKSYRVCAKFFLKTLDLQIRGIQKHMEDRKESELYIGYLQDRRGQHVAKNKTPE